MGDFPANNAAERALIDYLDGLLHDSDEPAEAIAPVELTVAPPTNITALDSIRAARPTRVVEALQTFAEPRPFAEPTRPLRIPLPPLAEPTVESPPAEISTPNISIPAELKAPPVPAVVEPEVIETPATDTAAAVHTPPVPPAWVNGRPLWAQRPFECLLFKSGGLTLAVPLVELGSIYPLEADDITGIFGQIDWFLGIMRTKYGNLRVVDTAKVVMPERYQPAMAEGYHFVLSLNESDWGLGIDDIEGTALLDPEAVRWRGERGKRPWLAGTVIEKMCAVLDVAQLRHMFDQLDRKRRS